jgi:hypothetical protein
MNKEAMKLALDGGSLYEITGCIEDIDKCIVHRSVLVQALAKQEQGEPVGFIADRYDGKMSGSAYPEPMAIWINQLPPIGSVLYTTPQQRKPLTDEQLKNHYQNNEWLDGVRFTEQFHGIKE